MNNSTKIYSLEGKDVLGGYVATTRKGFKNTMDFSLEVLKLNQLDREWRFKQDSEWFSRAIVCMNFNYSIRQYEPTIIKGKKIMTKRDYDTRTIDIDEFKDALYDAEGDRIAYDPELVKMDNERVMNAEKIRETLYKEGFTLTVVDSDTGEVIEERHMVRYKRSGGSARVGKCLFIDERYYEPMMKWSFMGLDPMTGIKGDLAGFEAYISLTMSGIIGTVSIKPNEILVIDDFDAKITEEVMATELVDGELVTQAGVHTVKNSIWDGQSLIDPSAMGKYSDKGMVLLRNRFCKTAAFNTEIQQFLADNEITDVAQLNGFTLATDVSQIKLITTPSSIKYMKYGSFESYMKQLESTFGVVKYEKPTKNFDGDLVSTHYQLINTLQLTEADASELLKPTLDYIKLLKTNDDVFRSYIKADTVNDHYSFSNSNDMVYSMLTCTKEFTKTDMYKQFQADSITAYINRVKKGKVLVRGNYSTLVGNPYEMLQSACGLWDGASSVVPKGCICNSKFSVGQELVGVRSPHITMGNILVAENVMPKEIVRYFNFSNEIVAMNALEMNVLQRLQGADYDSDTMMITDNPTILRLAKANYDKFLVPTNLVEGAKTPRTRTPEELSDLDVKTSKNLIGEIVNASQILNSLYWDRLAEGKVEDLDELYADIGQLSTMSGIEIDRAKKEFALKTEEELYADIEQLSTMSSIEIDRIKKEFELKTEDELRKLRGKWYIKDEDGHTIKPLFFGFLAELNGYETGAKFSEMHTGMDLLHKVLEKGVKGIKTPRRKEILTFLDLFPTREGSKRRDEDKAINLIIEGKQKISSIWSREYAKDRRYEDATNARAELVADLALMDLSEATVAGLLKRLGKEQKKVADNRKIKHKSRKKEIKAIHSIGRLLMTLLFVVYTEHFESLLEDVQDDSVIRIVREVEESEKVLDTLVIYGIEHKVVVKKVK